MKGVVFVELLKMAEDAFGEDTVDDVLEQAGIDGAYTAVGNYPCSELVSIVSAFSAHSGISGDVLQRKFGHWMMKFFNENYPGFFENKPGPFEMLEAVDGEIHVEVRKLYPDAELPRFVTERKSADELEMVYSSPRPLVDFCHGLIESCVDHFDRSAEIGIAPVESQQNSTAFRIRLTK